MSIYLGQHGRIELRRTFANKEISTTIDSSEVVAAKKRLAFDFVSQGDTSELITGDEIEIRADSNLVFLGLSTKSAKYFLNKDELGGVRLYNSYAHAISGGITNAISLTAQSEGWSLSVKITVQNAIPRILGQISSYELNTERSNVDITAIGEKYRKSHADLISGSGRIQMAWDYRDTQGSGEYETPHYLQQLLHRTQAGSTFKAHFFLKTSGYTPSGAAGTLLDVIYYDVWGLLTNTAFQFSSTETVDMTANFITTGEIKYTVKTETEYNALKEDDGDIVLEQDSSANLLLETD